ncbi:MAG TPA: NAD(P)H-binding protein [Rhizomicrobium sp.]|nr:NAD(P)H-binding protein [Rhizomicrobium sp.]
MKLAIFGATGKTGRLILQRALAAGHEVTVCVRDPARLGVQQERFRVVVGGVGDVKAVRDVVRGADAVISAVGGGGETLTAFARTVVAAMREANVSRIVSLIGASIPVQGDRTAPGRTLLHLMMRLVAKSVLKDGTRHARALERTSLAYTLVRPPRLTDAAASGRIRHRLQLPLSPASSISRADLAAFMLQVAEEGLYMREAPMVASQG